MALINCPHCGGQISTKSKTCVYCGRKVTYCPECDHVFPQELDKCPVCGRVLKSEGLIKASTPPANTPSSVNNADLIDSLRKQKPFQYKLLTSDLIIIRLIIALILVVPLIVVGLKFYAVVSDITDISNFLTRWEDFRKTAKTMLVLFCVSYPCVLLIFNCIKPLYAKFFCGRWMAAQNVNVSQYLNNYIKNLKNSSGNSKPDKKAMRPVRELIDYAYRAEKPSANALMIFHFMVCFILLSAAMILLMCFLVNGLLGFEFTIETSYISSGYGSYRNEYIKMHYELQYGWLVAVIIVYIIYALTFFAINKLYNNKLKEWTDKNIVEKDWLYDKFPKMFKMM